VAAQAAIAELAALRGAYNVARECSKVVLAQNPERSHSRSSPSGAPLQPRPGSKGKNILHQPELVCAAGGGPRKYEGVAALLGLEASPALAFAALSFWPVDAALAASALAAVVGLAFGAIVRLKLLESARVASSSSLY
jgi:hypothetical protein